MAETMKTLLYSDEPEVGMWVSQVNNGLTVTHLITAVTDDSFEVQCGERGGYGKLFTKRNGSYSPSMLFLPELGPFKPCSRCASRMVVERATKERVDLESRVNTLEQQIKELTRVLEATP